MRLMSWQEVCTIFQGCLCTGLSQSEYSRRSGKSMVVEYVVNKSRPTGSPGLYMFEFEVQWPVGNMPLIRPRPRVVQCSDWLICRTRLRFGIVSS